MPLEKGSSKAVISHNIEEMQKSGHSHKQAVAAALHNAKDGDIMSQTSETKLAASMTASQVNAKNKEFWEGSWGASAGEGGDQRQFPKPVTEYRGLDAYDAAASDQPISPIGVGSPSSHEGMAQEASNAGPVGDAGEGNSYTPAMNTSLAKVQGTKAKGQIAKGNAPLAQLLARNAAHYGKKALGQDAIPEQAGGVERATPVPLPPTAGYGAGAKDAPRIGPKTEAATKRAVSKANSANQQKAWSAEQERVRVRRGMGRNEEGGLR